MCLTREQKLEQLIRDLDRACGDAEGIGLLEIVAAATDSEYDRELLNEVLGDQ